MIPYSIAWEFGEPGVRMKVRAYGGSLDGEFSVEYIRDPRPGHEVIVRTGHHLVFEVYRYRHLCRYGDGRLEHVYDFVGFAGGFCRQEYTAMRAS